jgi:hypothetical protein
VPARTAPAPEAAHGDTTAAVPASAALAFIRDCAESVKRGASGALKTALASLGAVCGREQARRLATAKQGPPSADAGAADLAVWPER